MLNFSYNQTTTNATSLEFHMNQKDKLKKSPLALQKVLTTLCFVGATLVPSGTVANASMHCFVPNSQQVQQVNSIKDVQVETGAARTILELKSINEITNGLFQLIPANSNNCSEYVEYANIKNIITSKECVLSTNEIVYNIENPLINSIKYNTLGGMSAWMEGIFMKKPKVVPKKPVKCTASVNQKGKSMKVNEGFVDLGVFPLNTKKPTLKLTASVRRVETAKKVYS